MTARAPSHAVRRPPRRGPQAGFTLVELTVALMAGLIVVLGILTLSREASRTFQEESRGASAEAALRTAVDRMRADLQRAAFMSTPNIMADTTIARSPTATSNVAYVANTKMAGLLRLASLTVTQGGSVTTNTSTLSNLQSPALNPDSFEVGGNMTTTEQFDVQTIQLTAAGAQGGGPAGCTTILLSPLSGAMVRVGLSAATASQQLRNLFQPIPASDTNQFIVRLVDTSGKSQYLATCAEASAAGITAGQPWVDIDTKSTPIQFAGGAAGQSTGTQGGATGYCTGCTLNPVQIVRWQIEAVADEPAQYASALGRVAVGANDGGTDPAKFDLMRTFVDAFGNPVTDTSELIAEYAVDLKLAFSVDNTTLGDLNPSIVTFAFDDGTDNGKWSFDVSTKGSANVGPQRIRSAHVRLVTRAAMADRTVNIPLTNFTGQEFMYRYCLSTPCNTSGAANDDQSLHWARTRTITTEVALTNQAMAFY